MSNLCQYCGSSLPMAISGEAGLLECPQCGGRNPIPGPEPSLEADGPVSPHPWKSRPRSWRGRNPVLRTFNGLLLIPVCILFARGARHFVTDHDSLPGAVMVFVLALGFYLIPTLAAFDRKQPAVDRIMCLNLLAGWTVIGWIVALAMACGPGRKSQP